MLNLATQTLSIKRHEEEKSSFQHTTETWSDKPKCLSSARLFLGFWIVFFTRLPSKNWAILIGPSLVWVECDWIAWPVRLCWAHCCMNSQLQGNRTPGRSCCKGREPIFYTEIINQFLEFDSPMEWMLQRFILTIQLPVFDGWATKPLRRQLSVGDNIRNASIMPSYTLL